VQEEAQYRGCDQQQREDRDECVVGEYRRQVVALVVEELVDDRDRVSEYRLATLDPVEARQ